MASVTSLDKDLRRLRLDKYTPAAASEAKQWMEGVLGEPLSSSNLLDALKDGVALCRLVNLAVGPPGVKFKKSAMPFVQMENISHFLRACQSPPLSMQDHDMFLTVDLYEQKDPAQVLQCLLAFSRAAHSVNPTAFPTSIGPSLVSPQATGRSPPNKNRGISNVSSTSGRRSPGRSPTSSDRPVSPNVSSWSRKTHEGVTNPAWNIAQYGYMGGASQGNLGIVYGGRRQITGAGPYVPSVREKERRRKEGEAEALHQKQQMEGEELRRKAESEADEGGVRLEEGQRSAGGTARGRADEKRKAEEEKRRWEEEERQWKLTEEKRRQEEEAAEARLAEERRRAKSQSDARLKGQYSNQHQAEQSPSPQGTGTDAYLGRIKHLEKDLESARQREREYEEERSRRSPRSTNKRDQSRDPRHRSRTRPPSRQDSWSRSDREILQTAEPRGRDRSVPAPRERSVAPPRDRSAAPPRDRSVAPHERSGPPRPLPIPQAHGGTPLRSSPLRPQRTGESRPLPVPGQSTSRPTTPIRRPQPELPTRPLPSPTPATPEPAAPLSSPLSSSSSQPLQRSPSVKAAVAAANELAKSPSTPPLTKPKRLSVGFGSRSVLEREMELERQRQREWEEAQAETARTPRSPREVDGVGGRWDLSQWQGYTGGDSQNKGAQGIGAGKRQIVGPRPLPGRP